LKFTASAELNAVRWTNIKAEAAQLLPLPMARDSKPMPSTVELLKMSSDSANGEKVFFRQLPGCFTCHSVRGKGGQIGPDLSEIGTKLAKEAIVESILEPSAGISVGYETYSVELKSGDEGYGLLVSETADEIAIKDAKGIVTHYKKSDVTSKRKLKVSLMPTGLQQGMSAQEFADLVGFLSGLKKQ
jgi:putative heme-binding domain-containing protein